MPSSASRLTAHRVCMLRVRPERPLEVLASALAQHR